MIGASAAAGGMAGLLGVPAGESGLLEKKSVTVALETDCIEICMSTRRVEVVLIRMASDRAKPIGERFMYRNCFQGLYRIVKDEGVLALYRGWQPNTVSGDSCTGRVHRRLVRDAYEQVVLLQVRAILMNASQLASYDVFKKMLLGIKGSRDGPILQFGASFLAGTVATSKCRKDPVDIRSVSLTRGRYRAISHLCSR
jgi:dicarboxylate transporter 10